MSDNKPKLAEVITIHKSNRTDVISTLRHIADEMEAGDYGNTVECALVHHSEEKGLFVHGLGATEGASIHLLFTLGAHHIVTSTRELMRGTEE